MIIFPLILGLEAFLIAQHRLALRTSHFVLRPSHRPVWWPLLHGAATALFLVVWRVVPKFDRHRYALRAMSR